MMNWKFFLHALIAALMLATSLPAQIIPVESVGSLPGGRARHGAVFHNRNLYVIGGQDGWEPTFHRTVFRSPVDEQGIPSTWIVQNPIPHSRTIIDQSTVVFNNKLYVVGGFDGELSAWRTTVLMSEIAPYGDLGAWRELDAVPIPDSFLSGLVAAPGVNSIILLGGLSESMGCTDAVRAGILGPDGAVTEWVSCATLPTPFAYGYAGTTGGKLYAWGGMTTTDPTTGLNRRAYSTALQRDGRVGEWKAEPMELVEPFFESSSVQLGSYFFVYSPHYGNGQFTQEIYWSSLKAGSMGGFTKVNLAMSLAEYPGVAANPDNNIIYLTGGRPAHRGAGHSEVRVIRMRGN